MNFLKHTFRRLLSLFLLGCDGPLGASENRITIFTNSMAIWGQIAFFTTSKTLYNANIDLDLYFPQFVIMSFVGIFVLVFNYFRQHLLSRVIGILLLNAVGWNAAYLFGKSFNGYFIFFPALVYSVIALSKQGLFLRVIMVVFTFSGIPMIDWLCHKGYLPVTGLNSANYPVTVLILDSVVMLGYLTILMVVEKFFSDKYEFELQDLNENLENIVEKRTRLLVEAKEEAIQASLLKSQFVANTSHELRTPVQGIVGFVEMANQRLEKISHLDEKGETLRTKIAASLSAAEKASQRLLNLIDTLLKITRTESSNFTARPSSFDFQQYISELSKEIQVKKSIPRFALDYQSTKDFIFNDKTMIGQVIENLLTNAQRYSVGSKDIHILVKDEGNDIVVTIVNQSLGVDEFDKEKIFEPFVQGSRTDQMVGGTGLGLFLCKKYAKIVEGDVTLDDLSPEHTTFSFRFTSQFSKSVATV